MKDKPLSHAIKDKDVLSKAIMESNLREYNFYSGKYWKEKSLRYEGPKKKINGFNVKSQGKERKRSKGEARIGVK